VNRYTDRGMTANRGFATGLLTIVFLFIVTAAGIAWVGMGIVASDRWPIRWLEINGEFQRVSAEQLRATLTPQIDSSFFTVDLRSLDEAASRISWVSSVLIQKQWPDTVSVSIEEHVPVAHWNRGELISRLRKPFTVPEADEIQGLPWLQGPEARLPDVLNAWTDFNELLLPFGLEVEQLKLDQRGSWSMALDNGTYIHLGRNAATERLQRLLSSWDVLMQGKAMPPRDIDLRYTNGFAVKWSQLLEGTAGADS